MGNTVRDQNQLEWTKGIRVGWKRTKRAAGVAVGVAACLPFVNAYVGVAGATSYADPGLCKNPGTDTAISIPSSWLVVNDHGTNDWIVNGNGYSVRTCFWGGTDHGYNYACTAAASGWTVQIVAAAEESFRDVNAVHCDGTWNAFNWNTGSQHVNAFVHMHLWSPGSGGSCGDGCAYTLSGLGLNVSAK